MNIKNAIISIAIIATMTSSSAFAMSIAPVSAIDSKNYIPVNQNSTYSFDENALKNEFNNRKHELYKVECSKSVIQNSLGLKDSRIFSVGLEKGGMDLTYDLKNCSLYGNNNTFDYSAQKVLTKSEALEIANDFYTKHIKTDSAIYNKVGAPVITYRNYGPIMYAKGEMAVNTMIDDEIEIDEDNVTDIEKEYTSFSITYPFLIGGKEVYSNYGNLYGITMEVYKSGVSSINVPLLKFKLVKKNSELMSETDLTGFVKKGGNSVYYGPESGITLGKIKSVYVVNTIYTGNRNDNYLSTGIGLFSESEINVGTSEKYKQIISDYKIGNANFY